MVYTCLFGYSELLADTKYRRDGLTDFICFTDDRSLRSKTWKFVYVDIETMDPVRVAKMVKILAHRYVGQYETSLYLNNTAQLVCSVSEIFAHLGNDGAPMVCFCHPERSCVYKEAELVAKERYDDIRVIQDQMGHYRSIGHPEDAGLIFGGVLLRRHNDARLQAVMEQWFDQVCAYSYRDQLSFNVIARQLGFTPDYFPGHPGDGKLVLSPVVKANIRLPRGFRDDVYLELHEDVRRSGMNAREHYLKHGMPEGRPYRHPDRPN
ncbi:glycosyltransferase domain-containing protein [Mesorhizobium sp. B2-3-4]|uniref:glycosyltransferase domain-containing protein n=1 Tax=Mesorhizobium sp. B2-3-4 TaxID=2589959 RepID=UPI00112C8346|nr:glycosyltransferase domain-containing protein [Mesorhizobium sp. B2-3-4]